MDDCCGTGCLQTAVVLLKLFCLADCDSSVNYLADCGGVVAEKSAVVFYFFEVCCGPSGFSVKLQ